MVVVCVLHQLISLKQSRTQDLVPSRTGVVHYVAQVQAYYSIDLNPFCSLIRTIFSESVCLINYYSGYYGHRHARIFHDYHLNK